MDYKTGYRSAIDELNNKEIELNAAIYSFQIDPPTTNFQKGFRDALRSIKKHGHPIYHDGNVAYIGFKILETIELINRDS
tara:strand:+ start:176 stop:415 length:240 start_codon:yes stop_codon:yes gene_type:complete